MENLKPIEEIKGVCDAIQVQVALNNVQLQVIADMLLSVYTATIPSKNAKNIINNYFDALKKNQAEALAKIEPLLYDARFALRPMMDLHFLLEKERASYLDGFSDGE